jgi:hypothetical protein
VRPVFFVIPALELTTPPRARPTGRTPSPPPFAASQGPSSRSWCAGAGQDASAVSGAVGRWLGASRADVAKGLADGSLRPFHQQGKPNRPRLPSVTFRPCDVTALAWV